MVRKAQAKAPTLVAGSEGGRCSIGWIDTLLRKTDGLWLSFLARIAKRRNSWRLYMFFLIEGIFMFLIFIAALLLYMLTWAQINNVNQDCMSDPEILTDYDLSNYSIENSQSFICQDAAGTLEDIGAACDLIDLDSILYVTLVSGIIMATQAVVNFLLACSFRMFTNLAPEMLQHGKTTCLSKCLGGMCKALPWLNRFLHFSQGMLLWAFWLLLVNQYCKGDLARTHKCRNYQKTCAYNKMKNCRYHFQYCDPNTDLFKNCLIDTERIAFSGRMDVRLLTHDQCARCKVLAADFALATDEDEFYLLNEDARGGEDWNCKADATKCFYTTVWSSIACECTAMVDVIDPAKLGSLTGSCGGSGAAPAPAGDGDGAAAPAPAAAGDGDGAAAAAAPAGDGDGDGDGGGRRQLQAPGNWTSFGYAAADPTPESSRYAQRPSEADAMMLQRLTTTEFGEAESLMLQELSITEPGEADAMMLQRVTTTEPGEADAMMLQRLTTTDYREQENRMEWASSWPFPSPTAHVPEQQPPREWAVPRLAYANTLSHQAFHVPRYLQGDADGDGGTADGDGATADGDAPAGDGGAADGDGATADGDGGAAAGDGAAGDGGGAAAGNGTAGAGSAAVVTTLTASASVGDTVINVAETDGIDYGMQIELSSDSATEAHLIVAINGVGPPSTNGTNSTAGADGADGDGGATDGADGTGDGAGADGADGADGAGAADGADGAGAGDGAGDGDGGRRLSGGGRRYRFSGGGRRLAPGTLTLDNPLANAFGMGTTVTASVVTTTTSAESTTSTPEPAHWAPPISAQECPNFPTNPEAYWFSFEDCAQQGSSVYRACLLYCYLAACFWFGFTFFGQVVRTTSKPEPWFYQPAPPDESIVWRLFRYVGP